MRIITTRIGPAAVALFLVLDGNRLFGGESDTNSLKRVVYRSQAGTADARGWYPAESTGAHFKVKLPVRFTDFAVLGVDEHHQKVETYIVGTVTKEKTKYTATLAVKPPPKEKEFFDGFLEDMKKKGGLRSSRRITIRGHTALEAELGDPVRSATMRMIVVENGVYGLIVEFDTGRKDALQGEIKTFFDSFEFPPAAAPAKKGR